MTSKDPEKQDREELLLKLISGTIDPESEEGRAMLQRVPELAKELEGLRNLSSRMDEAAAAEQETLEVLDTELPPSPAATKALKSLWNEGAQGKSGAVPKNYGTPWLKYCLAAALFILLLFVFSILDNSEEPKRRYLGDSIKVTSPQGRVDQYQFEWQAITLPPGGRFVLFIDSGKGPMECWRGTENQWDPESGRRTDLPDKIVWWVEAYGPNDFDPIAVSDAITLIRTLD